MSAESRTVAPNEVPASSANLGPGFDTLALALDILDTVTVELDAGADEVVLVSGGEGMTSEGEFFEALNAACLGKLPILKSRPSHLSR